MQVLGHERCLGERGCSGRHAGAQARKRMLGSVDRYSSVQTNTRVSMRVLGNVAMVLELTEHFDIRNDQVMEKTIKESGYHQLIHLHCRDIFAGQKQLLLLCLYVLPVSLLLLLVASGA